MALISLGESISGSPDSAKRLGIILVTYNSASVIKQCVESCLRYAAADILVIDNASADDTVSCLASFPAVTVIANQTNRGFAAAVNQGVRRLDTEFILLLNPDTELLSRVEPLVDLCENDSSVAAAAGALVDVAGQHYQQGFSIRNLPKPVTLIFETLGLNRIWPGNPLNRRYRRIGWDASQEAAVEQPAGAFFLFRKSIWKQLGGFDERFFPIWFEDVDFCKRIYDAHCTIRYLPAVKAAHRGGHSASQLEKSDKFQFWYVSLLRYAEKHFSKPSFRLLCAVVGLRAATSGIVEIIRCAAHAGRGPRIPLRMAVAGLMWGRFPQDLITRRDY